MINISTPDFILYIFAVLIIFYVFKIVAQRYECDRHNRLLLNCRIRKIQERVRKKLFFSHKETIQSMSHEDLLVFKQTYDNTVTNAVTIKVSGPTKKKNLKNHRVKFIIVKSEETMDLSLIDGENENLIK